MSNREKQLIGLVVVLLALLVMYYSLYRPMTNRRDQLESDIAALESQLVDVRAEYEKMPEYKEGIVMAKANIESIEEDYPTGLSQESGFKLVFDIEETFDEFIFANMNFSTVETIRSSDDKNNENTLYGLKQVLSSNLSFEYDELKDFLAFINEYPQRTVLTSLNMSLNEENGEIESGVILNQYAISGGDREFIVPEFEKVPTGKEQIFEAPDLKPSSNSNSNGGDSRPTDPQADLFVTLKPTQSDIEAQIIGLTGDDTQQSYVKQDFNDTAYAILRIYQSNGQYYANYDIEGVYKEGNVFSVGNALEMTVYSTLRLEDNDRAGMALTVINETGSTLYIDVRDDDPNDPRLVVNVSKGKVVTY